MDSSNAEPGLSAIARLAAATALPKPAAAHAAPIDLRLCARRLESASSSHARTSSGKSGRIDDSLQDPGLAASTGMASSGSCSVDGLRPYIRGYPATISPVSGSVICTLSQRTRGQEPPPVQRGAGEVPVRVDVYLPVLVGPAALPSDRVERGGGQRHQRRAVLLERVPDGVAPAVVPRRGGQRVASVEHDPSELRVGLGLQRRDHEVAAEEPDRVLHRAFLPTGIGVAEPRVDAVVREERVEHRGGRHLAPRVPASRAGGVVHDDHWRDSADVLEHLDRPVAQAFRVLPGQARRVSHIRMGERDDQAVVVHELAGDAGLRHAEIDLRDAGRPDELAVSVGTAPVRLAPASHVPRRRRVLAVVLGLRAEPVVHAFGGVALLAGQHAVGLEPSVDQRRVRVDLGAAAPVRGRFRRHVVHVGVFRDSGAVHVRPPRDLRPGHSLTVQSPDILLFGHRYRHRPFLPERRRLQPADSFLGHISGIYRHGGLVPVFVWAVIRCSFRWKPAAYAVEK